jgi:C4-dicarboxylate-binding protein DctP
MKKAVSAVAPLFVVLTLVLTAGAAACGEETDGATAGSHAVELEFSYHTPENASLVGTYFKPWTAAIEEASNGTLEITHYPGETRVKQADQYDAVVNGLSDIALIDADVTPGRFPKAEFYGLPGLFPNARVAAEAYYDVVQEFCASDEFEDVRILAAVAIAPAEYVGTRPAQKPQDFQGQRVRAGGKIEGWMIDQLGGTPVEVSTGDLLASMERGLIDSAFLSWSLVLSSGVKDVTEYRTQCDLFYRCWLLVMNKDVWDSLSPDQQKAIEDCSGVENSGMYSAKNEAEAASALQVIEASDKNVGKPPIYMLSAAEKEEWKRAVLPVWDRWVGQLGDAGLPGLQILNRTQALIETYSTR